MVEITAVYQGELRCEATHGPSGNTLLTDAPVDNQGKGETFSPTDLVATALGTCMLTILGIVGQRHELDLAGARVRVEKHMATEGPRRIGRLPVTIEISNDPEAEVRQIVEKAILACPVHRSLHPDIDSPVKIVWGAKA